MHFQQMSRYPKQIPNDWLSAIDEWIEENGVKQLDNKCYNSDSPCFNLDSSVAAVERREQLNAKKPKIERRPRNSNKPTVLNRLKADLRQSDYAKLTDYGSTNTLRQYISKLRDHGWVIDNVYKNKVIIGYKLVKSADGFIDLNGARKKR